MIIIVKESWFLTKFDALFIINSARRIRYKELRFLNVRAMNLVHFPSMAIGVQTASVFNWWIDSTHVFKAPKTSAHSLLYRIYFYLSSSTYSSLFNGKENRQQRETNTCRIVLHFVQIRYADVVTAISLIEQTINGTMELTDLTWFGLKTKTDIKGRVSRGFYQNQLS